MNSKRCSWAKSELDIAYHDNHWGRPLYDDVALFEMLILEGMQAGLSWSTILAKREHMKKVFDNFDAAIIAKYTDEKKAELLQDPGIIRNKAKINALILNAQAYLRIKEEMTFSDYIWSFVGTPIVNEWTELSQIPAKTDISEKMSKELLKKGFKFVGPTICYAFMQAVGMVNDHMTWCKCYNYVNDKN